MSEHLLHPAECDCHDCRVWFTNMQSAGRSGRCGACGSPIDDHPKDKGGTIEGCPAKAHA